MRGDGRLRESFLPRQRPREEWAHVLVTRDGARYVDVEELLQDEKVKMLVSRLKTDLKVHRHGKNAGEHSYH